MSSHRPYQDMRVLDATHVLSGPFASYQLGLLGAEVIRIDRPDEADPVRGRGPVAALNARGQGLNYLTQGANKRSIVLDLKRPEGLALFWKLAETADVFLENFRTGALAALGIDFATFSARNNRIVYCSLTGFGQSGPLAPVGAYDPVIQAISGMMRPDASGRPVRAGGPIVDYASGMAAAFAISAALLQRERFGGAQHIDCSMLETALTLIGPAVVAERYGGTRDVSMPHDPGLDCYRTMEGFFQAGCYTVAQNRRFWLSMDRPDLAAPGSWEELWALAEPMREAFAATMLTRSADAWEAHFQTLRIPGARVRSLAEAARLSHLDARGFFADVDLPGFDGGPVQLPGAAFRFAHDSAGIDAPPPAAGADTDAVLVELGFSPEAIAGLHAAGVIQSAFQP